MAISKSIMQLEGSLANVSMYKMHGSDKVIVRAKGGPSKKQIETKPQFEKLRQSNSEWAGCSQMASRIRKSFGVMNRLDDYPVTGALNGICKEIQKLDTENESGKRAIRLSQHKNMISGFSFSSKQVLESVLRVPIETNLERVNGEARIEIPEVNADMYLYNFRNLPYYRIIASLSGVCDLFFPKDGSQYESPYHGYCDPEQGISESEWMPTLGIQPAKIIHLHYPLTENPIPDEVTLMLCIGIEFGKVGPGNIPCGVKYAGTGKIVKVG
jgi:hypothetical protein